MDAQRQRPLAPLLRHAAVTTEATTSLYLSLFLSHTVTLCTVTLYTLTYKSATTTTFMFSLSHIYTYMTFGLFT